MSGNGRNSDYTAVNVSFWDKDSAQRFEMGCNFLCLFTFPAGWRPGHLSVSVFLLICHFVVVHLITFVFFVYRTRSANDPKIER